MVRTDQTRLRAVWRFLYEAVIRGVVTYLRLGQPHSAVYVRGSVGFGQPVYGISDIDMTAVVPGVGQRSELGRDRTRRRWERLCRAVPPLGELLDLRIYREDELEKVVAGSPALTFVPKGSPDADPAANSMFFGSPPLADENGLRAGPGLYAATRSWRLVGGTGLCPPADEQVGYRRCVACWPELQHWWRALFKACAQPVRVDRRAQAYFCVKLVAEPVRIWLWLAHGMQVFGRRDALRRAIPLMPDEEETLRWALDLHRALPRDPEPPLADVLRAFLRLTSRIADRLSVEAAPAGTTTVRLLWDREEDPVLSADALEPLRALTGHEPELLPLVDWRGLVCASHPDELLAVVPIEATDLDALTAAAIAGRGGPYPAVRADGLLILPATDGGARDLMARRTAFRSVQCALTDPVSFAVLDGADAASFPNVPGWCAQDWARRAVEEHRARLSSLGERPDDAGDRLAPLLAAARAALFAESIEDGNPELCLTGASVAARLGERVPGASSVQRAVLALPEYRHEEPGHIRSV